MSDRTGSSEPSNAEPNAPGVDDIVSVTASDVAAAIDHTLLAVVATDADVVALCADANRFDVAAVCVSPSRLPLTAGTLNDGIAIATVCGFPSGSHRPESKAAEAARSIELGATEIDMVLDLGRVKAGTWDAVVEDIATVRGSVPPDLVLKVIIESAALTDDEIVRCCESAEAAAADFVKTSTGFHPAGGATIEAVHLMASTVGGRLGVKASGGVRTWEAAVAMIHAGATRIGTSSTEAILGGAPA
jgi:deoxyribose-phosphate aldolase